MGMHVARRGGDALMAIFERGDMVRVCLNPMVARLKLISALHWHYQLLK